MLSWGASGQPAFGPCSDLYVVRRALCKEEVEGSRPGPATIVPNLDETQEDGAGK